MSESAMVTLKRFFAGLGKIFSILGKVVRGLITLILLVGLIAWIGLLVRGFSGTAESVPESGALRIDLQGLLVDELTYQDPLNLLLSQEGPAEHSVQQLLRAIDAAAEDDRISHIVLLLHGFAGGGSSKITEVGDALLKFRERGKAVFASADFYSQPAYLLASYADEIHLNPMGLVDLRGLATYRSYYGDALDKLKVNFHVFRTSDFKDALEPFIDNQMSDASRAQTEIWLNDIWASWSELILSNRSQLDQAGLERYSRELDQLMLEYGGDAALVALQTGLVDQVLPRDESLKRMVQAIGSDAESALFYSHINYRPYVAQLDREPQENAVRVGLVTATGIIMDGRQPAGSIGGDSLSLQLRQIRENPDIDALLLRVDSPGGSAFASELIRRELELISAMDIPIVVSMSSSAASGGYWISMPADEIWALPTTLTGSIGAFSAVPTFEDSLAALGISSDGVATGPLAGALQLDRPLSDQAATILQANLEHLYDSFVQRVSDSRNIDPQQLQQYAQGRVWTGRQARDIGLVDHLGGLQQAAQSAAALAGNAEQYRLVAVERPYSWREELARLIGGGAKSLVPGLSASQLGTLLQLLGLQSAELQLAVSLNDPGHRYLICGSCSLGAF